MAPSLCGAIVRSRRGMLAFGWSIVSMLTGIAFIIALVFAVKHSNYEDDYDWDNEDGGDKNSDNYGAVTSRAMGFAALWTAVLAGIMAVYGTIILGYQSLSGEYYWCCAGTVHSTSPLSLGAFIGGLIMFANLTLVSSVLFGEFEIRDNNQYNQNGENQNQDQYKAQDSVERSSAAFSVMCMFLTVIYAAFAALVYTFSDQILEENRADLRNEALSPSEPDPAPGYIGGERFDIINPRKDHNPAGFLQAEQSHNTLFGSTREDTERGFIKPDQDSRSGSLG